MPAQGSLLIHGGTEAVLAIPVITIPSATMEKNPKYEMVLS